MDIVEQLRMCGDSISNHAATEIERLRAAIKQLAKDHPDTAVSWPHNGLTCYQDLHDWASFVLYGAAKAKGGGDG